MAAKVRVHREWFRTVLAGGRKSCPFCHAKLSPGESLWQWGEYVRAKWRNVLTSPFCKQCYENRVKQPIIAHAGPCGCEFEFVGYGGEKLPEWLTVPTECTPDTK